MVDSKRNEKYSEKSNMAEAMHERIRDIQGVRHFLCTQETFTKVYVKEKPSTVSFKRLLVNLKEVWSL